MSKDSFCQIEEGSISYVQISETKETRLIVSKYQPQGLPVNSDLFVITTKRHYYKTNFKGVKPSSPVDFIYRGFYLIEDMILAENMAAELLRKAYNAPNVLQIEFDPGLMIPDHWHKNLLPWDKALQEAKLSLPLSLQEVGLDRMESIGRKIAPDTLKVHKI